MNTVSLSACIRRWLYLSGVPPALLAALVIGISPASTAAGESPWETGIFSWNATGPLVDPGPGRIAEDPHVSVKDPTLVFHEGRWHLFASLRKKSGQVGMEYLNFTDWSQANQAPRHELALHDQYHCAPQVFYFTPHKKWYLVYQLADKTRTPPFGPCFSTTENLADPKSWTSQRAMITNAPAKPKWLDFWVICDNEKAYLFYTSLDGHLWRRETKKTDFPYGWSGQQLALQADIFEASHTYKFKGRNQYLTLVEAQGAGRRYYKAYLADRLDGSWRGLADSLKQPFAAAGNIQQETEWTTSISHGELIRAGVDEYLEVDPTNLRFVFQGASDKEYRSQSYGGIPWRIGILEMKK